MKKRTTWKSWLDLRFNLKPIRKHVVYHQVAQNPWYYGDGVTLIFLLATLFLTGMFLALGYSPSPATAYSSVQYITFETYLGWFVRGLHYWSAGMMTLILLYHVGRHIALGGYLPPREGIWLVGVILFFLIITTSFIGYTLRWDERSVYALRVALNIFYKIPIIGDEVVRFVQGGWEIGAQTLSRLYAVHTLFVPFSLMLLIAYHLYLVLTYGATTPLEKIHAPETAEEQIELREREKNHPKTGFAFFPYMIAKDGGFAVGIFTITVILTLIFGPEDLYPEANLINTSFPQEEWWFHWYSGLAAYLPPLISDHFHWIFPLVVFLSLASLPFLDHGANRGPKRRPLALISVSIIVIFLLTFTGLRLKSSWTAWPRDQLPPLPTEVKLTENALEGRKLFTKYGCFNCHSIGGEGSQFAPNLSELARRMSHQELQEFIQQPPTGVAMPSYKDRLTNDELEKIADFVLVIQTQPGDY